MQLLSKSRLSLPRKKIPALHWSLDEAVISTSEYAFTELRERKNDAAPGQREAEIDTPHHPRKSPRHLCCSRIVVGVRSGRKKGFHRDRGTMTSQRHIHPPFPFGISRSLGKRRTLGISGATSAEGCHPVTRR